MVNCIESVRESIKNPELVDESRKTAIRDEINGIIVDTVLAFDTDKWETGIKIDENWIVVEQYENKTEAIEGHKKYVEEVKNGKRDFDKIDENEL